MAASLSGVFSVQEFTDLGNPLVGGRLYTYVPATTTLKIAYTDPDGLIPQTYTADGLGGQYIALNARGELPAGLFLSPGGYDLALKTAAGVTVWTRRATGTLQDAISEVLLDLSNPNGSSLVNFLQAGPDAVLRSLQSKGRDTVSVKDFGAVGDGATDDTQAIQSAINSFPNGNGCIHFPPGSYKTTSEIIVDESRIHLVGAGPWASRIIFAPTANGSCIRVSDGSNMVVQGSIRSLSLWSSDITFSKVGIELVDTGGYVVEDVVISGTIEAVAGSFFWSGGTASTGLVTRGREACRINGFYCYADRPIHIRDNPNNSIDIDHFDFMNCYLAAAWNPNITIDSGVNLSNVQFGGYQVWVLGNSGLLWIDTTSSRVSQNLRLSGVRWEQGQSGSAWCVWIEHNFGLQGFAIESSQFDLTRNGVRLRKVSGTGFRQTISGASTGQTVLDVDSTVDGINIDECLWTPGSVVSLVGQVLVQGSPMPQSSAPLRPSARYQSSAITDQRTSTDMANGGKLLTLAAGAIVGLGTETMAGMLTVIDSEYLSAQFGLRGTYHVVDEVADPASVYSVAGGTASMTNVYWSAPNNRYEIQNNRGVARRYLIVLSGTYSAF